MQQDQDSQRNMILAIVLSLGVLALWQFLIAGPQQERERVRQLQERQLKEGAKPNAVPGAQSGVPGSTQVGVPPLTVATQTREQAVKDGPRLVVETPSLKGSINLRGALIDDLTLLKYREAVKPGSANVHYLSPTSAPEPYFAEFGWLVPKGSTTPVPDAATVWTAPAGAKLTPATPVVLTHDNGQGLVFKRTISIDADYMFTVKDEVENKSGGEATLVPYGRIYRFGTPKVEGWYILHEGPIAVTSDTLEELSYSDLTKDAEKAAKAGKPAEGRKIFKPSTGGWVGFTDKYWSAVLIPDQKRPFDAQIEVIGKSAANAKEIFWSNYQSAPLTVAAGQSVSNQTQFFAGAKQQAIIDGYQKTFAITKFEKMIDWGYFHFITQPLFKVIHWLYGLFGNFGVAILAITVIVKGVFFPLQNKSYESMAKMKKLQPEMEKLRKDFGDDRMKQQQAMMELYKKEKINPAAGCLPVLLQFPVFFALYKVIFISIDMRHAPFIGWIKDLSAPDPTSIFNLFGLLPFGVPDFLMVGVWPLIMGATMWMQFQLNPPQPDPTQQMIFNWMPVMLTFMMATMPAGLIIYWSWSNVISFAQQYYITKKNGAEIHIWDNLKRMFGKK
jgi:YidC/Oxa1 family membrane protein insertase